MAEGFNVDTKLGSAVGVRDGVRELNSSTVVGASVDTAEGLSLGASVGNTDGASVGTMLGASDGVTVGATDGDADGAELGPSVGTCVGDADGASVGIPVGNTVGVGVRSALGRGVVDDEASGVVLAMPMMDWPPSVLRAPLARVRILFFSGACRRRTPSLGPERTLMVSLVLKRPRQQQGTTAPSGSAQTLHGCGGKREKKRDARSECSDSKVRADAAGRVIARTTLPAACTATATDELGRPSRAASSVRIVERAEDVKSSTSPDIVTYSVSAAAFGLLAPAPETGGADGAAVGW